MFGVHALCFACFFVMFLRYSSVVRSLVYLGQLSVLFQPYCPVHSSALSVVGELKLKLQLKKDSRPRSTVVSSATIGIKLYIV